jgi:hypothetical protein
LHSSGIRLKSDLGLEKHNSKSAYDFSEDPKGFPFFLFYICTTCNVNMSSKCSVVARRCALSNQKTTEDNTLNVPCRKYVETMWNLLIFYTFSPISFSARAPPSGRASIGGRNELHYVSKLLLCAFDHEYVLWMYPCCALKKWGIPKKKRVLTKKVQNSPEKNVGLGPVL